METSSPPSDMSDRSSPAPKSSTSSPRLRLPTVSKTKKPTKKPKEDSKGLHARTYYRRKEEKELLEREVQGLMLQLQHLARRGVVEIRRDALALKMKRNKELRDSIQGQRIIFANTQSFISEFLRAHDHSRYEPVIRLGTDQHERYEMLLAMKQQRLEEAVYFLSERSRQMAMDTEYTDLQRFQSTNGDVCLVRFDIKPLPAARNVAQAFEGVLKFSYNLEISISDLVGDLTIRENDVEDWDRSVAQHRLVTTVNQDVQVDTNNVTFTHFWGDGLGPRVDRAIGDEIGIAVCNYVDEDALYPYREDTRVRQDITFFVVVTKYPRLLPGAFDTRHPSVSDENDDGMVVATRWTCLRLRKPSFPLDEATAAHIRDGMEQVGQGMFTAINHSVDGQVTQRSVH